MELLSRSSQITMYIPFTSAQNLVERLTTTQHDQPIWLLCISDRHAEEMPSLFTEARNRGVPICGGIFPGLIDGNRRRDEGVIAIPLYGAVKLITGTLKRDHVEWTTPLPDLPQEKTTSALIFLDSQSPAIVPFMDTIYDQYGTSMHYVGAGAGYRDLRNVPAIFSPSGFIRHGGLLILLPLAITVNVRHGWKRVAGPFIASRTDSKVIQELNWETAGTLYRQEVEALAPELKDKPVFPDLGSRFPLSIGKQSAEDVVRDPFMINNADEILLLSDVPENSAIYISEGNKDTLIDAAHQAVAECADTTSVTTCFISDCYSRALMLGDELETELDRASTALKQFTDTKAQGVLALGEICGNGRTNLEFYNKTFVVALIH